MKTFTNQFAQGDCFGRRIDAIPADAHPVSAENGTYVLAHSETGHNHVIDERPEVKLYQDASDPLKAYLEVLSINVMLEHKRAHDTHEAISIPPGNYEIRRQREYMPEGFRRAAD